MSLSERLYEIVRNSGMTHIEFANKMGVSIATQRNYQRGLKKPNTDYLTRLYEAGFDVVYLITGKRNTETLTDEDSEILRVWHQADTILREAALRVLDDQFLEKHPLTLLWKKFN